MKKNIALVFLLSFFIGCSQNVTTPNISQNSKNITKPFKIKPYNNNIPYQDIADKKVTMPKVGQINSYGIIVDENLKTAYESYLKGDGTGALEALNDAQKQSNKPLLYKWQISFLKVKVYSLLGLDADAMSELKKSEILEYKAFGNNLNSTALKGEINIMEGDFLQARKNFSIVLNSIGNWELPTSYTMPPSNIKELVAITTAQLRAMTGMAASYLMQENYKSALIWAKEAELRFNAMHYVSNHFIYGKYLKTHLDSYYGRALNLAVLASSTLAVTKETQKADKLYINALKFFDLIGYKKGKIITLALKSKTLLSIQEYDKAKKVADDAIKSALQNNMYDFIWRIEMIKGLSLIEQNKLLEAKKVLKNAADVLDIVSGELQNDFSKRRFGIGKSDLVYELMQIDLKNNDLKELFSDIEQGRARAFVDLMANQLINQNNFSQELTDIKELDEKIKKLSLKNRLEDNKVTLKKERDLRQKRKKLAQQLFKKSPKSASIVSSLSFGVEDVQKKLDKNEAIVYFLPVKSYEEISYLLIEKEKLSLLHYKITPNELSSLFNKYLIQLDEYYSSNIKSTNFNTLKKKVFLHHIDKDRIYIVASGNRSYIPWYGLDTKKNISIIPSVSTIFFKHQKITTKSNVVLGDPYFNGKFPQLSGAKQEAIELANYYNIKPLLYKEASFSNLQKNILNQTNIIHLATHGIFNYTKPMDSAIFLSQNDGLYVWSAKDILQDSIKSNLVILSACQTGLGKSIEGDDLLGLPRSLFLSGTKAVLSSLWEVDDKSTKEFMLEFHKRSKDGKYAKALNQTASYFKKMGYDPSVYGGFVLYGTDLN